MMKKIALIILLVMVCVAPAYAQDTQQQTTTAPPVFAGELLDKARDLLTAQDYSGAVTNLSLFILVNPTYTFGYYLRAQSYLSLNDMENALKDVDQAIATSPANATADYGAAL